MAAFEPNLKCVQIRSIVVKTIMNKRHIRVEEILKLARLKRLEILNAPISTSAFHSLVGQWRALLIRYTSRS